MQRGNKVLVPILFLIGGFHFDHLNKWQVILDVTFCMITKHMNKWLFTIFKYNCHSFALSLPYGKLSSYSIGHVQTSNEYLRTFEDPILDIPEGSTRLGRGHVPHGSAPAPPPRPPISLEQLLATQNDMMRRLVEND
jgi:hypothetical protein